MLISVPTLYTGQGQFEVFAIANDVRLTNVNRYSIREQSPNAWDQTFSSNNTRIFSLFIEQVNNQLKYNKNGEINAIPIVAYHRIDDSKLPASTDISLFAAKMKYLHDNGFMVITMDKIGYDINTKYLDIKKQR